LRGFGTRVAELALAKGDNVVATARCAAAVAERFGEKPNLLTAPLDGDATLNADATLGMTCVGFTSTA
jgi:hypothetical protein